MQTHFGNGSAFAAGLFALIVLGGLAILNFAGYLVERRVWLLLAGASIASVVVWTAVPFGGPGSGLGRSLSLVPFEGISRQRSNINRDLGVINILGNIALFIPVGFFLRAAGRWSLPISVVIGVASSVMIEMLQFTTGTRVADIDDVILNAAGVMVGALGAITIVNRRKKSSPHTATV